MREIAVQQSASRQIAPNELAQTHCHRCLHSRQTHPAPCNTRRRGPPARRRPAPGAHAASAGAGRPRPSRRRAGGVRSAIHRRILAPMLRWGRGPRMPRHARRCEPQANHSTRRRLHRARCRRKDRKHTPPLRPPAWPDTADPPPADAQCSRCGGAAWWCEAMSPRYGWCCCCWYCAPQV